LLRHFASLKAVCIAGHGYFSGFFPGARKNASKKRNAGKFCILLLACVQLLQAEKDKLDKLEIFQAPPLWFFPPTKFILPWDFIILIVRETLQ
jgi:hypothetical protein